MTNLNALRAALEARHIAIVEEAYTFLEDFGY